MRGAFFRNRHQAVDSICQSFSSNFVSFYHLIHSIHFGVVCALVGMQQHLELPEVRQAVVPGRRGALPRHLQNVLLGVTDMTNELWSLRQQNAELKEFVNSMENELGEVRLELATEQRISDERAEEIERLLDEGQDTLALRQEVSKSSFGQETWSQSRAAGSNAFRNFLENCFPERIFDFFFS